MPPSETSSVIPCPENGRLVLICQNCSPKLELYETNDEPPSFLALLGEQKESVTLFKNGKYRLILVNDDDDPETLWQYHFRIEWRDGNKRRTLVNIKEDGQGQVFIKRDVSFREITE